MSNELSSGILSQNQDSKQQQVYKQIRHAIVTSEFPPGTVMVERKLCEIYNMSRSPIRNALQQLTFEGLLAYVPGKGTVVPSFNLEDILEVFDLLEVLQVYATNQCIHQIDIVGIETMRMIINNTKAALARNDLYETSIWDQRFHDFIADRANNHRLKNLFEQLNNHRVRFVTPALDDHEHYEKSTKEHDEIFEYISTRNAEAAVEAVHRHYATLKQYYISLLINKNFIS